MRGRMNEGRSYAEPQPLNQVMVGGTVGEVVDSRSPQFQVGDQVVGMGGWQQYLLVDANQRGVLQKVDSSQIPLSAYLGAVGMPGVTAWYGLLKVIAPQAGETVVVIGRQRRGRQCRRPTRQAARLPRRRHRRRPGEVPRGGRGVTASTPASTTASIRSRSHSQRRFRRRVRTASTVISRTSAAPSSTR
jgi:hypothetical protein